MFIINNKGFSLPEIMIAVGLMGGISLVTTKLITDQSAGQAVLRSQGEINKAVSVLETALNSTASCNAILGGKTIGSVVTSLQMPIPSGGARVFLTDQTPNNDYGSFIINAGSMVLQNDPDLGASSNIKDLVISFNIKNGLSMTGSGNTTVKKTIRIAMLMNGTTISGCGPVLSGATSAAAQKMCSSFGSSATWNGTSCSFNGFKCPWGQVPTKFVSMNSVPCTDLASQIDLGDIFDFSTSTNCVGKPNISMAISAGKFGLVCY